MIQQFLQTLWNNLHHYRMAPDDPKMMEEWVPCEKCCKWYHESCAELKRVC